MRKTIFRGNGELPSGKNLTRLVKPNTESLQTVRSSRKSFPTSELSF